MLIAFIMIFPFHHAVNDNALQKIWEAMGTLHQQEDGTIR
jgi:hypothetical protein